MPTGNEETARLNEESMSTSVQEQQEDEISQSNEDKRQNCTECGKTGAERGCLTFNGVKCPAIF